MAEYILTCYSGLQRVGRAKVVMATPDRIATVARAYARLVGAPVCKYREVVR